MHELIGFFVGAGAQLTDLLQYTAAAFFLVDNLVILVYHNKNIGLLVARILQKLACA